MTDPPVTDPPATDPPATDGSGGAGSGGATTPRGLPATGSSSPLLAWTALLLILGGVGVLRWLAWGRRSAARLSGR